MMLDHAESWRPWRAYAALHLLTADADATRALATEWEIHDALAA